ncbi:outer membrane protein assembly factor BamD [Hydrogenimonas thermophila]|uniref:Beta-barrel assembly machine subunit BamD n=1 Tax=Hydrogenimonas thermophila TaxID=223786 RepID=A0A1I5M9P2_9BACT|nr:outer membrane protein assembly factor BamD [Hydrogenimonas thermophila]SFP06230.1 Beta-barrel assembly machine subunit BamD [Hydrogenimonas thermophila]
MFRNIIIFLIFGSVVIFNNGCSSKVEQEYEKPAIYWYQKLIRSVSSGNLEKADSYFTSLESEHISSPLIPEAMLILVQAHMDSEEYLLANFYLDEYIKRYGNRQNKEFAQYLKIKAAFLGLNSPRCDQKLILDTLKKAQSYIEKYPNGIYTPYVHTIQVRLEMTEYMMNESIAKLYKRRDKDKASKIYEEKNSKSRIKKGDIQPPANSWVDWLLY